MQRIFYALTLLALVFTVGCGGALIKGTIETKDGTKLTEGIVRFLSESGKEEYQADIRPDGTFSPGMTKDGEPIPHGVYQIYLTGVGLPLPPLKGEEGMRLPALTVDPAMAKSLSTEVGNKIHIKYGMPDTSGLSINTRETKTLKLVLDPPE